MQCNTISQVNASKITPQSKFKDDLDLDSLDTVEVVMTLEEEFCIEIPDSEADKIFSIPDAVAYLYQWTCYGEVFDR